MNGENGSICWHTSSGVDVDGREWTVASGQGNTTSDKSGGRERPRKRGQGERRWKK